MVEGSGPRNDVLSEQITGLTKRFDSFETRSESRFDSLATKDELFKMIEARDALFNHQIADLRDDNKQLMSALSSEINERKAGDKENEDRAKSARAFALSAVGLAISLVLGLAAFINIVGGSPAT